MLYQGRSVDCGMVREFSEEKRQEIFRMLDEIDNREWKSFMEWSGSGAEEYGDWPDKLSVSAYTRYVDEYHQKVLELNEMTRQRVNTVFENVAEIDARYAARMRECQEKIKGQIAIVRTMTEFMQSMTDGNPNMALITKGGTNGNGGSLIVNNTVKDEIEFNCYWVRENFSLFNYGTEECLENMTDLYQNGYVSKEDYRAFCYWNEIISHVPSAEADKIRNMMQECIEHVITTVYIYNCLQILAKRTITPKECCEANEIFRYFGITDRNSIACLLICCAGESGGFINTQEIYDEDSDYPYEARGAGYLQVTGKVDQERCLRYIYNMYGIEDDIDTTKLGYSDDLANYPWEASAWRWTQYAQTKDGCLNLYVVAHCNENEEKLTLGIVLTAESFVHGDVRPNNNSGGYTMNDALVVIVSDDSLRSNDKGEDGGWYIVENENDNKDYTLYIPAEMLEIEEDEDETPTSDIPSEGDTFEWLRFTAPYNWSKFEAYYNDLQEAGLIDFDQNTELP